MPDSVEQRGAAVDGYRALREGCGVVDRSEADQLDLTGDDRERFLNGMVTCRVKGLPAGHGSHGFLTDIQGKILSDAVVLALEDRLRLLLPPGRGGAIERHLGNYLIADRVEISVPPDSAGVLLAGPRAASVAVSLGMPEALSTRPWGHAPVDLPWGPARIFVDRRWGVPGFGLLATADLVAALLRSVGVGALAEAALADRQALDTVRVEEGVPLYGREFAADALPQETGLSEMVSYEKGCYLGQEVIARIHYRGKVNRLLRGLLFEGGLPAVGTGLLYEGREAGVVGTAVMSPRTGGGAGLAIIHRRAAEVGTRLELSTGGSARVVELPLP